MDISEELVRQTALRTLEIERAALEVLRDSVDEHFVACILGIYRSPGRVIVTGIGKSALIAQKIVATFNSTGTPAVFMHAADAIHGDLGMIQPEDVVLCLSKSGETPEIKVLVPLLQRLGNPLIAMVGRLDSFLAQQARYALLTPIEQEADPNNLAPTASTTSQLALGDAMATALLALRGFTAGDFAQFHPGGMLGKQLYLRVSDLYPQNERPAVQLSDDLPRTILEMTAKRLGCTVVLDDERVAGIVTDGDLRRMLEKKPDLTQLRAADIMSPAPKTIPPAAMAMEALSIMQRHSITQLVVVDGQRYLGIIHLHNLIREGLV